MKTKYGEIKSIRDFFESIGKKKVSNPQADKFMQVIMDKVKCKLCGEILEIQSPEGAMISRNGEAVWSCLDRHIELHRLIKDLS